MASRRRRHERPLKRTNPSGEEVWIARYTGRDGKRRSAGTFKAWREAMEEIDRAYDLEYGDGPVARERGTVGEFAKTWTRLHPRSDRTDRSYDYRLKAVMDVKVGGHRFRDWRMMDVQRGEIMVLLDHLLRKQGRAVSGASAVLRTVSAMWEDAITDRWATVNPVRGIRVRAADPRVRKPPRRIEVWTMEQMRKFAAAAGAHPYGEAMALTLALCGLRLGEMLPLERGDVDAGWLWVRRTAHEGYVTPGTKMTRGLAEDSRKALLPGELETVLRALPPRLDTRLLFPAPRGRVRQERSFYREVWQPARDAVPAMAAASPHEFRHSHVSIMRAAGVDPADLARWTGHTVLTATTRYTHSTGASEDRGRGALSG